MQLRALLAIGAAIWATAFQAFAQSYPDKPIRIVIPQAVGGGSDLVARLMAPELQKRLGQAIVIDNRPGGNETIGPDLVAKAAPDGYTIGVISATHSVNQTSAGIKLRFDPQKSFIPVAPMMRLTMIVIVNDSLGINDVKTLIERSKSAPGTFNYGSAGSNTFAGIGTEYFVRKTGADITGVTYGSKGILQAIAANDIQMAFGGFAAASPILQPGKAKVIAVTSAKRSPRLPDVPTVAENYPGFEVNAWYGFVAPAGTPAPIVDKLNRAIGETIQSLAPRLLDMGNEAMVMTPAEFKTFLADDLESWKKIVQATR